MLALWTTDMIVFIICHVKKVIQISMGSFVCNCSCIIIDGHAVCLAVLCFYSKTGFWLSYCQISTDLDKILHTPIVVRNTLVGRLRP